MTTKTDANDNGKRPQAHPCAAQADPEARQRARCERHGSEQPRCSVCGCADDRLLFERHHIAGRRCSKETVSVCANCHRRLSDDQYDHPALLSQSPAQLEMLAHLLLGVADLLVLVGEILREQASGLLLVVRDCPAPWGYSSSTEKAS